MAFLDMFNFLKSIMAPMISLFILILGNGFLMTLVPLRADLEGFSSETMGYLAAAYFGGMLLGALKINKVIEGVGHVRAFAFFASVISILTLLQGLFVNPLFWIIARFLFGLCMAGIFVTIESWLLVQSSIKMRGIALSIYMTIFYAAQSASQLFLGIFDLHSLLPFCFIVILASLSVLPVTIIKTKAPIVHEHSILSPIKLFKLSPLALIAAIFSGLILGPIYGLLPIYAQTANYSTHQTSLVMGTIIFGGLAFQWPIGAFSDRTDRRKVLLFSSVLACLLALFVCLFPQMSFSLFLIFSTLLGGFCFVLYPLSVSHACDLVDSKELVAATGAVLFSYGIGSIIGPILASYSMKMFGGIALFYFLFINASLLAAITFIRIVAKTQVPPEEKLHYSNMPRSTPVAYELDPRIEESSDKEKKPH